LVCCGIGIADVLHPVVFGTGMLWHASLHLQLNGKGQHQNLKIPAKNAIIANNLNQFNV
jgi:hypothetical protein